MLESGCEEQTTRSLFYKFLGRFDKKYILLSLLQSTTVIYRALIGTSMLYANLTNIYLFQKIPNGFQFKNETRSLRGKTMHNNCTSTSLPSAWYTRTLGLHPMIPPRPTTFSIYLQRPIFLATNPLARIFSQCVCAAEQINICLLHA
jgi:hypothetical protein